MCFKIWKSLTLLFALIFKLDKLTFNVFREYELIKLWIWSFRSECETVSNGYRSELSDLNSALVVVKREADLKHTKLKDQKNTVEVLQQEFEDEDALVKSLQLKVSFVSN